jgi:hypothetical protein
MGVISVIHGCFVFPQTGGADFRGPFWYQPACASGEIQRTSWWEKVPRVRWHTGYGGKIGKGKGRVKRESSSGVCRERDEALRVRVTETRHNRIGHQPFPSDSLEIIVWMSRHWLRGAKSQIGATI